MSVERWLPVVGYGGLYEVSDCGRVRSLDREVRHTDGRVRRLRGKVLSPITADDGRLVVTLPGRPRRKRRVHQLVLEAFVGPCPEGMEACHFPDPDPTNNALTNLRWDTQSENMRDRVRNGTHHESCKTHCPDGHEYTPENTYVDRKGARNCRSCWNRHGK